MLREVFENLATWPVATVETFYGEISVTWKMASATVRTVWFHDGRTGLVEGDIAKPFGNFTVKYSPTGKDIALAIEKMIEAH